ncbi:organ-specific protein S2-like [Macadamia integrifolia]|uniref:organ-specific protein S2-like n=1 Tax=Macadamia integrifolia TaxID=60698 RepID=UPI001C4F4089|nr:organ-specific protein S2-like [Macadamia integrifolia]
MEFVLAFLTISSLLLFSNSIDARKDPAEYWKDVMKEQPMPEAIQGLLPSNTGSDAALEKTQNKEQKFNLDLNIQSTAIIYHGHDEHNKEEDKASMKGFELNSSEKKSFVKEFKPRPNYVFI